MMPGRVWPLSSRISDAYRSAVLSDSPAHYWPMGAVDDIIAGNDLSVTGDPAVGAIRVGGKSYILSDDALVSQSTPSIPGLPITVEFIVNYSEFSGNYSVITNSHPSFYYGVFVRANADGSLNILIGDGTGSGSNDRKNYETPTGIINIGADYHIAIVVYSMSDVKFRINGIQYDGVAYSGSAISASFAAGLVYVGLNNSVGGSPSGYTDMEISDLAIYASGLSKTVTDNHYIISGI